MDDTIVSQRKEGQPKSKKLAIQFAQTLQRGPFLCENPRSTTAKSVPLLQGTTDFRRKYTSESTTSTHGFSFPAKNRRIHGSI